MWSSRLRPALLCSVIALGACSSTATRLPEIGLPDLRIEAVTQEARAMSVLRRDTERLLRVARPILRDNAALCPKTRADIGVIVHSEDDYDKELRLAARRELGARELPRIFVVAEDSPAARAGLRVGDEIWINDEPATGKDLREALKDGATTLEIIRGEQTLSLTVEPDTICRSNLRMQSSSAINAYADGRNITVTSGMMEFADGDNELALIIGHELGHNTMGHIRKVIGNLLLSGFATRYTRPFESESDYVGLYYMVRAGYDPTGVENFWRRLAEVDPRSVNRAKTHPTFPDRYLRIAATRAEIEAKQAAGEPLVPNFKKTDDTPSDDGDA